MQVPLGKRGHSFKAKTSTCLNETFKMTTIPKRDAISMEHSRASRGQARRQSGSGNNCATGAQFTDIAGTA